LQFFYGHNKIISENNYQQFVLPKFISCDRGSLIAYLFSFFCEKTVLSKCIKYPVKNTMFFYLCNKDFTLCGHKADACWAVLQGARKIKKLKRYDIPGS